MRGPPIADRAGVSEARLKDSMAQLARDRLLDAAEGINLTGHTLARGVSPEGLRAIREWPSSETLSELLEGLAHRTDDRSGKRS